MADTRVSFSLVLINSDTNMPIPFDHKHIFKYIRVLADIDQGLDEIPSDKKRQYVPMRLCTI